MTENPQDKVFVSGRQFGRIPSKIDKRDWLLDDFTPDVMMFGICDEREWLFPQEPLDQGDTPHCVGYSMAHFGINLPTYTKYTKEDAEKFYYDCKILDGEPKKENGTTVRNAAKVLQDVGAIEHYAFAKNIDQIKWWLLNKGPLVMGTIWTETMMKPNTDGTLLVGGYIVGGHAYIVNELRSDGYFGIQNSWGDDWGLIGKAYISEEDFEYLFSYGGEALAAVELEKYKAKKDGWFIRLIKKIFKALGINWD